MCLHLFIRLLVHGMNYLVNTWECGSYSAPSHVQCTYHNVYTGLIFCVCIQQTCMQAPTLNQWLACTCSNHICASSIMSCADITVNALHVHSLGGGASCLHIFEYTYHKVCVRFYKVCLYWAKMNVFVKVWVTFMSWVPNINKLKWSYMPQ